MTPLAEARSLMAYAGQLRNDAVAAAGRRQVEMLDDADRYERSARAICHQHGLGDPTLI